MSNIRSAAPTSVCPLRPPSPCPTHTPQRLCYRGAAASSSACDALRAGDRGPTGASMKTGGRGETPKLNPGVGGGT